MKILHVRYLLIECGELMEMCCEQAEGMNLGSDMSA